MICKIFVIVMGPRGMQNSQMMGNRMMPPQPNMANQLTQMAQLQQRKVRKNVSLHWNQIPLDRMKLLKT